MVPTFGGGQTRVVGLGTECATCDTLMMGAQATGSRWGEVSPASVGTAKRLHIPRRRCPSLGLLARLRWNALMMRAACRSIRWNWLERTLRVVAVGALSSLGVLLVSLPGIAQDKDAKPSANSPTFSVEQIAFFEKQVQPILKSRCLKCHGGEEKIRGEFRVTSRAAILRGGESGPAAKPGDPMASSLIAAVEYRELEMPPSGKLPAGEIEILRRWVKDGLPWTPGSDVDEPEPHKPAARSGVVTEEARRYWAYQPLRRPSVPKPAG
jgi:hypothetical protein